MLETEEVQVPNKFKLCSSIQFRVLSEQEDPNSVGVIS
jgi:hypothetical protein